MTNFTVNWSFFTPALLHRLKFPLLFGIVFGVRQRVALMRWCLRSDGIRNRGAMLRLILDAIEEGKRPHHPGREHEAIHEGGQAERWIDVLSI